MTCDIYNTYYDYNLPNLVQLGSLKKSNFVSALQVTSLLPLLTAPESEQVTSTTVPGSIGNLAAVSIVLFHSAFSPVHPTVKVLTLIIKISLILYFFHTELDYIR